MDLQLFTALKETVIRAHGNVVAETKQEPEGWYYLLGPEGTIPVLTRRAAQPIDHKAATVEDLVRVIVDECRDSDTEEGDEVGQVWVDRSGIVYLYAASDRRHRVTVPLTFSPQTKTLCLLEQNRQLRKQAEMVRLLRLDLAGAIEPEALLAHVRNVVFSSKSAAEGKVVHGKASIGRALEAELQGAGSLPEKVSAHLRVFTELADSTCVDLLVDVDPAQESFLLVPLPGEIEEAVQRVLGYVQARLRNLLAEADRKDVPVYLGVPSRG